MSTHTARKPEWWEHSGTPNAVCPHCGYEGRDSWELGGGSDETGETECGRCERIFRWSREIEVTYTTEVIEGEC